MPSTAKDRISVAEPGEGSGSTASWMDEMRVTFDSDELSSFFEGFEPLEVDVDDRGSQCLGGCDVRTLRSGL